eukprot:2682359-Prymnesium_polylepis.1
MDGRVSRVAPIPGLLPPMAIGIVGHESKIIHGGGYHEWLDDPITPLAIKLNEAIGAALKVLSELTGVEETTGLLLELAELKAGDHWDGNAHGRKSAVLADSVKKQLQQELGREPTTQECEVAQREVCTQRLVTELGREPTADEVQTALKQAAHAPAHTRLSQAHDRR